MRAARGPALRQGGGRVPRPRPPLQAGHQGVPRQRQVVRHHQRHLLLELQSSALLQGRLRRPGAGPGAGGRGVRPQPDTSRAEPLPGEETGGDDGEDNGENDHFQAIQMKKDKSRRTSIHHQSLITLSRK